MNTKQQTLESLKKDRNRRQRRGATIVEFALVGPLFFLFLLASIEFSRLNVMRHTASQAAYEAARTAIVPGANAGEATAVAQALLQSVGAQDANVQVNPAAIDPGTTEVTVTVDIPLQNNVFVISKFTSNRSVQGQSTLRTERVRTIGD